MQRITLRLGWRCGAALIVMLFAYAGSKSAEAHAFMERSDPASNSVVPTVPSQIQLWFTEPIESSYSNARLFDVRGEPITTEASSVDPADPKRLFLPLPEDLAPGTYTVVWRNISSVDGHPSEGFFAFTIGSESNVTLPAAPAAVQFSGGPPVAIEAIGRWLILLGSMAILGILATAAWVLPAGINRVDLLTRDRVRKTLWRIALMALIATLIGGAIVLIDQSLTVESRLTAAGVMTLLRDSSFGHNWLARTGTIVFLGAVLLLVRHGGESRFQQYHLPLIILAIVPLVPLARSSHAAAISGGRIAASVSDLAHLVAASFWVGGLIALVVVVLVIGRTAARRSALVSILPRFSTLAIGSVIVVLLTGLYATWLEVGNLTGLTDTDYGKVLAMKILLTLVMLGLGAVNLLILEPRLRSAASTGIHFGRTVTAEAFLGVGVLLLVGFLTSLPTARGALESNSGQIQSTLSEGNVRARITITPGAIGVNRYVVDLDGITSEPNQTTVLLRVSPPESALGSGFLSEIDLTPVDEKRYEAQGSELSVVGDWNLELILRRPEAVDWRATMHATIDQTAPEQAIPGRALLFHGQVGGGSVVLILLGFPVIIVGMRGTRRNTPLFTGGLMLIVGIFGLILSAGYSHL